MNRSTRRRVHNNAVQDTTEKAKMSWRSVHKSVTLSVGHLDGVDASQARAFADEIDSDVKADVDQMAIHERGSDGIGYATVKDGEFTGFTLYAQYQH